MKTNFAKIWFLLALVISMTGVSISHAEKEPDAQQKPQVVSVEEGVEGSKVQPRGATGGVGGAELAAPPARITEQETMGRGISPVSHEPVVRARLVCWSMLSVASASLIVGGVFGFQAMSENERYEENPSRQFRDRARSREIASYTALGIGAATAVAAVIAGLIWHKGRSNKKDLLVTGDVRNGGTLHSGLGTLIWTF